MRKIDRIFELMNKNNINAMELANRVDISPASFTNWKKGEYEPSADAIVKIADYFNVSIDYMLGKTDNPYIPSEEEQRKSMLEGLLLEETRNFTDEQLNELLQFAEFLKQKRKQ